MSAYEITVIDKVQRNLLIGELVSQSRDARIDHAVRKGRARLKIISIPIDALVYRLENYRTRSIQLSLQAQHKHGAGFFNVERTEEQPAQQAQHEILVGEAKRGSGETIKPIFNEFERVRRQTEDLLITHDGIVLNGNRRLSAMRELYAQDPSMYQSFEEVVCAVLPDDITPPEMRAIEITLQMQPDTKLPYDWTAVGRAARDLRISGHTDEQIAAQMNREKKEVERFISKLDAADIYLTEWICFPEDYSLLDATEQAFHQVATRNIAGGRETDQREATLAFDFFLIEQRALLADRAYKFINDIEENPEIFLEQIAKELGVPIENKSAALPMGQLYIQLDEHDLVTPDYQPLIDRLRQIRLDKDLVVGVTATIQNVCMNVSEQGKNKGGAAKKFAIDALNKLNAIDITTAAAATIPDIIDTLGAMISRIDQIHRDIERHAQAGK
ncbi:hypothetical protein [Janthinobacterium aquaticum]|uniref:hypothetical protein n=1 Tax=Janthinobacterium sp. FT58W TaxID=2654254 RepID=UPI0012655BC7|nr:hypothetical protein [Janthinobacterium sp. FT58W]KAB8043148.1 hypothetical protein GCM43_11040 [Janthinobacterium sp. FT58W]